MNIPENWPTQETAGYRHAGAAFDLASWCGATDTERAMKIFAYLLDQAEIDMPAEWVIEQMEKA